MQLNFRFWHLMWREQGPMAPVQPAYKSGTSLLAGTYWPLHSHSYTCGIMDGPLPPAWRNRHGPSLPNGGHTFRHPHGSFVWQYGDRYSSPCGLSICPPRDQYNKIAKPVAAHLSPTITEALDRAITVGISQLMQELGNHAKCLSELEHCLSDLEGEVHASHTTDQQYAQKQQYI